MKLNKIPKSELELLSYIEIAKLVLEENNIADFFQSLTTSKEFILLEDGKWDLKNNHSIKVSIDDIYDDTTAEDNEDEDNLEEEIEEDTDDINSINDDESYQDEDDDNDLANLTIIDEDELEE